jgi:rhodanese-related sulfurtransferase
MSSERYEPIPGDELYRRMAMGERVIVLDVRTENEFERQHIPGALLIPLQSLEQRLIELPREDGVPIAAVCEQGNRSVSACRLLAEHGYSRLLALHGGLAAWPGPLASGLGPNGVHRHGIRPSSFLVENFDLLPRGLALDLAMGEGRNAIYLATRGYDVDGVEADPARVARARTAARRLNAPIRAIVGNVEDGTWTVPLDTYDVIMVFNFLHRPLYDDIKDGLVRGGVVVYQTYTVEQARYGAPRDPRHLLRPGELREVFADYEVLRYREFVGPRRGERNSPRAIAGIIARKPS